MILWQGQGAQAGIQNSNPPPLMLRMGNRDATLCWGREGGAKCKSSDPGLLFDPGIEPSGRPHAGIGMQKGLHRNPHSGAFSTMLAGAFVQCQHVHFLQSCHVDVCNELVCIFYNASMCICAMYSCAFSEMQSGCNALYTSLARICTFTYSKLNFRPQELL